MKNPAKTKSRPQLSSRLINSIRSVLSDVPEHLDQRADTIFRELNDYSASSLLIEEFNIVKQRREQKKKNVSAAKQFEEAASRRDFERAVELIKELSIEPVEALKKLIRRAHYRQIEKLFWV